MADVTYSQALNMALREEMRRDPRVFWLGEDIKESTYGVTRGLYDEFGARRVVGTPISETAIAGAALGAALVGLRPVAEFMYMTFMMCAMDQLVNQAAKSKYMFGGKATLPIVYRTMTGAGRANAAQHTQSLEAWFAHVPGLKVVMPATAYDAKGLLKTAIRDENPVVFIENKVLYATAKGNVPHGACCRTLPTTVVEWNRKENATETPAEGPWRLCAGRFESQNDGKLRYTALSAHPLEFGNRPHGRI
jgi:pyruvate dehydrogenase E1 component beta subunit